LRAHRVWSGARIDTPLRRRRTRGVFSWRRYVARVGLFRRFCVHVDPVEDGVVPEAAVARLQDPVAFVGEPEQARLDPAPLQRAEHAEALLDRDAEVELALDDQRRGLEVLDVRGG